MKKKQESGKPNSVAKQLFKNERMHFSRDIIHNRYLVSANLPVGQWL